VAFTAKASIPKLEKEAERAILEQFRAIAAALTALEAPSQVVTPLKFGDYVAHVGELVRAVPPAAGMRVLLPAGSEQNDSESVRVAIESVASGGSVTVAVAGATQLINGATTIVIPTVGLTEFVSLGKSGWSAAASGGGGLTAPVALTDIAAIADETFLGNVSGAPAPPSAINLSSLAGTNLTWNSALNRLDASGGGGAAAMTDATITVAYGAHSATATVVDAAIGAGSRVGIFWGTVLASDVNDPEADDVTFTCTPAAGSMLVRVSSDKAPVGGPYKIRYLIG
jgi:hypothetical protein